MRRGAAVVAEMVDAMDLESISLARECGFESRRPHRTRTFTSIQHGKEKGHVKTKARTETRNPQDRGQLEGRREDGDTSRETANTQGENRCQRIDVRLGRLRKPHRSSYAASAQARPRKRPPGIRSATQRAARRKPAVRSSSTHLIVTDGAALPGASARQDSSY